MNSVKSNGNDFFKMSGSRYINSIDKSSLCSCRIQMPGTGFSLLLIEISDQGTSQIFKNNKEEINTLKVSLLWQAGTKTTQKALHFLKIIWVKPLNVKEYKKRNN